MNCTIKNLVFCIEKLKCNGSSIHKKNNILTKLSLIKRNLKEDTFKKVESDAIKFIIKQTKINEKMEE